MPKFTNHAEMVKSLAKPGEEIIAQMTPLKAHLWHMASCVMGEVGELIEAIATGNVDGIKEELGDDEFYLEGIRAPLNISREETIENGMKGDSNNLAISASVLFDSVKKHVIYNKELDMRAVIEGLHAHECDLKAVRLEYGITYEEAVQGNLDKLNVRYAEGYSDKAAQKRADKVAS